MNTSALRRALAFAVVTTMTLTVASTASATESTPEQEFEAPTLTMSTPGILTLPSGDGVRDTTSVRISSTSPTVVWLGIREQGSVSAPVAFDTLELTADSLSAEASVSVADFDAGTFELVATPATGTGASVELIVGSGEPITVATSLSNSSIYSWSKASPNSTTVKVSALDETGSTVAFTGTVDATVGSTTTSANVASTTGASASAVISGAKLAAGTGSVTATVSGPTLTKYTSPAKQLKVTQTAATGVAIKSSYATIYPFKDSYLDSTTLTVTPKTTTSASFASTGTVSITRDGKTVKSWTLTSSKAWTATWDGKVGGKIVPGTYTAKVSIKGPEGSTQTATTTVKVAATALSSVAIKSSYATIYPVKDSYRDSAKFSVTPKSTTGKTVASTGKVTVYYKGKSVKSWSLTSSKAWTATWDGKVKGKIVPGTYTVKVSIKGPEGATKTASSTVKVATTTVNSVALKSSQSTVYPSKDGYLDSTKFTVTAKTSTGTAVKASGKVTVYYKGKAVKSWNLSTSKTWTGTWDGKVKGKIVPGTYTVKVSIKGPEGTTKTTSTSVKVSKAKLTTKTKTVNYKANSVITGYEEFSASGLGECYKNYFSNGDIMCEGYSAYYLDSISLIASGSVAVPSEVVSAQKYGGASVKITMDASYTYGTSVWFYDRTDLGSRQIGAANYGKNSLGSLSLPSTSKRLYVGVALGEYSDLGVSTFTVKYTYKVLK